LYREAAKKDPFNEKLKAQLENAKARAAASHYADGRRALEAHRVAEAVREFKTALGLDSSKVEHHAGMADALRLKEAGNRSHYLSHSFPRAVELKARSAGMCQTPSTPSCCSERKGLPG
jgi:hypothetical protein